MRVNTEKIYIPVIPSFKKFRLEFTIETEEEAQFFYDLFNYAPVCRLLEEKSANITGGEVRDSIEKAVKGINVKNWDKFLSYFA